MFLRPALLLRNILVPLAKNNNPQFILVEGPSGIGKSVLLKEIAYRWGAKQVLQDLKFVLLVFNKLNQFMTFSSCSV